MRSYLLSTAFWFFLAQRALAESLFPISPWQIIVATNPWLAKVSPPPTGQTLCGTFNTFKFILPNGDQIQVDGDVYVLDDGSIVVFKQGVPIAVQVYSTRDFYLYWNQLYKNTIPLNWTPDGWGTVGAGAGFGDTVSLSTPLWSAPYVDSFRPPAGPSSTVSVSQ